MKKQVKIKEPIRIRMKRLSNGCQSIYLDIYMNGKRQYDFLKLYVIPENSKEDKERNRETLKLVNAIKARKIVELQNRNHGFNCKAPTGTMLCDYIRTLYQSGVPNKSRKSALQAIVYHLERYDPKGTLLEKVDKAYLLGFIGYLRNAKQEHCKAIKRLHENTQFYYFKLLCFCLNYAVSEEYISCNPANKIKNEEKPKRNRREREFLTIDELKCLIRTPFYNDLLKKAFLFSCFCGLRHCDIVSLKWKNIRRDRKGNVSIYFVQQKTRQPVSLPLSSQAIKYLPASEGAAETESVFAGLISLGRSNEILDKWACYAGISKHLTFHVARHTHATMMLTLGVDLYTISKLLGHANIQTTQVYAKLVDESKQKAVALIPDMDS